MAASKADIIAQLQKIILPLQGYKSASGRALVDLGWGDLNKAFPGNQFPTGAIHEFICSNTAGSSASAGFIAGILGALTRSKTVSVWISSSRTLFPPALKLFGIEPHTIIFIDLEKESDVLWAMEEALQCEGLSAVVAEIKEISFTASRRFQLAVEQSRVTGFILRKNPRNCNPIACIARWRISPLPSISEEDLPGVGFPCWNIELLRIRNGRPGVWAMQWTPQGFEIIPENRQKAYPSQKRKTG